MSAKKDMFSYLDFTNNLSFKFWCNMFSSATYKSSLPDYLLRVKCKLSSGLSEPLSDTG